MSIVVFYLNPFLDNKVESQNFLSTQLKDALSTAELLRKLKMKHVTISSEMEDSVGAAGVSSVEDGKTPDGQDYTWKKRRI